MSIRPAFKWAAASQLYAPGIALLNLFPLPNVGGQIGCNYTSQISGQQPRREDLVRADYNLSSKVRVFGHYINNEQPIVYPYGSFVLGINVPIAPMLYPNPGLSWAAGATYIISPTMTNEFNMAHNSIDIVEQGKALTRAASGINLPLLYPSAVQDNYIPGFQFGGSHLANSPVFTSVGDAPFHNYNTTIDISDNIGKIWGQHAIKGGIYVQRSRKNQNGADFLPQNQDPTLVAANPKALLGNNALSPNFLRPLIGYGTVALYESAATSNYNALQVSLNKRATTGLFFGLSYTWSKALTTATSDSTYVRRRPNQGCRLWSGQLRPPAYLCAQLRLQFAKPKMG